MSIAADSKFHVLAVDDSLIDRKLMRGLLKISSFQVTTVDSVEVEVNLIITDYCMPGMSGYDLLKKIKESSSLRNIPVVIMSSENVPSRITRCLQEGAEEFFLKPVQLSDLNRLKPHMMKTKCISSQVLIAAETTGPKPKNRTLELGRAKRPEASVTRQAREGAPQHRPSHRANQQSKGRQCSTKEQKQSCNL
ncbi:hypothetical protein GH714_033895 [Hevea brasiliensis]|uniref:Response regulatory domain-containing protein n=1 Tax=Hevea brasiliensis TaxID=3981 RepID=A0A6A6KMV0_HEVBR|nr:hypothetical protein GH714_033895 [Hevea brasiliensis]